MTIHWSLLVPGLLLLWFPADRLLSRAVQLRSFDCFPSLQRGSRHRPWWWVPALWLDPGRGFFGTWLLTRAFGLEAAAGFSFVAGLPYGIVVGGLGLAVLSQTFSQREENVLLAPIGFVVGLVLAITSWPIAAVGLTMGLVGLFAFREFHAFFAVSLVAVAVLGFAFEVPPMWLLPAVGALALPVAAGLMTGRTLELPTRDASAPRRHMAPPPANPAPAPALMNDHKQALARAQALQAGILAAPGVWLPRREILLEWLAGFLQRSAAQGATGAEDSADLTALEHFLRQRKVPVV